MSAVLETAPPKLMTADELLRQRMARGRESCMSNGFGQLLARSVCAGGQAAVCSPQSVSARWAVRSANRLNASRNSTGRRTTSGYSNPASTHANQFRS